MAANKGTRTTSRSFRLLAALAAATALALGSARASDAVGGSQVVGGVVESQFGAAIAADGTVAGSASTIEVSVTRSVEDGVEVITIAPRS